jgi:uncharacterized repeat protein (TIGR04076 family)
MEIFEMAQMKYFKIKVSVDSVAGKCPLGNRPGNEFVIERTTPAGMCLSAFNSINPAIQVLRYGGSFPWEKNPDEAYICVVIPAKAGIQSFQYVLDAPSTLLRVVSLSNHGSSPA